MSITAASVKELRERTGAGMMDCKKALGEAAGNMDAAIDWLRKKGLAAAAKKAGRTAAEGLIGVAIEGTQAAITEVNAETDFVGRNEDFQNFVKTATQLSANANGNMDAWTATDYPGTGRTIGEEITNLIAVIGENMSLRRTASLSVETGVVSSYVHSSVAPNLGRIGVIIALESSGDSGKLAEVGKQLAMHIAASNPQVLTIDQITDEMRAHEREVLKDQVRVKMEKIDQYIISKIVPKTEGILTVKESNKCAFETQSKELAKLIRKEIEGKESISMDRIRELAVSESVISSTVEADLDKFVNEAALVEQSFVMNTKKKVGEVLADLAQSLDTPVEVKGFVRFELGEGIDKKEENFAEEVAAQLS